MGFQQNTWSRQGLLFTGKKTSHILTVSEIESCFQLYQQGNTIAFSGRAMGDDEPKYLNSPETPIFNKSKTLYNFHHARPHIRKKEQVVIFEGFADCISAVRAGVENSVATMGTALTEQHIQLLKRNTDQILICYDSDSAGLNAANRAVNMLQDHDFSVKVAHMPDNLDPDDYIKEFGEKALFLK